MPVWWGWGLLALTALLEVYPLRDAILPPFTSKVTRTAFAALWGLEPSLGRRGSFSVLFREGRPLYRRLDSGEVLTARAGERLTARVSMLCGEEPPLPRESARVVFGGVEFEARVSQIEVVRLEELRVDVPRKFVLRFLTPTLLPVPGRGKLLRGTPVRRRYRLVPDLPLALRLLAYDLKLQGVGLVEATPFQLFRWAYRALAELDYRVRPETVLYTVRDGKPSVERGFTGYVLYELLDPLSSHAGDLARLLAFMLRFGVGKSRSIGFGHVTMEPPPRNLL